MWGIVAQWIRHLLTVLRDPGSQPRGGNNLHIFKCMFCSVHLIKKIKTKALIGANPKKKLEKNKK